MNLTTRPARHDSRPRKAKSAKKPGEAVENAAFALTAALTIVTYQRTAPLDRHDPGPLKKRHR